MEMIDLARRDFVFADVEGSERMSVLRTLSALMVKNGVVPEADRLYEALWERELLQSTGVGDGVAIPHCKVRGLKKVVMAVATCSQEVDFEAPDGQPVRLVFLLLSPVNEAVAHLRSLAAVSTWLRDRPRLADKLAGLAEDAIFSALFPEPKLEAATIEPPSSETPSSETPASETPPSETV